MPKRGVVLRVIGRADPIWGSVPFKGIFIDDKINYQHVVSKLREVAPDESKFFLPCYAGENSTTPCYCGEYPPLDVDTFLELFNPKKYPTVYVLLSDTYVAAEGAHIFKDAMKSISSI